MEPAESLPPRPMQRKRSRAAVHLKIEASKVEKRVNTANNKTKRRPAQLKALKGDDWKNEYPKLLASSPCSSNQVPPSVDSVQQAQGEPRRGTRNRKPTKRFDDSAGQS